MRSLKLNPMGFSVDSTSTRIIKMADQLKIALLALYEIQEWDNETEVKSKYKTQSNRAKEAIKLMKAIGTPEIQSEGPSESES